jgi:UbiD family decarboxylase
MHDSMRAFLADLETAGRLRRIARPVDRSWEPGSLIKWMFQALPDDRRFGLYFERVDGCAIPLVTGALGGSTHSVALALGVEPEAMNERILHALRNRIAPRTVAAAPVQEIVKLGPDANLDELPIPVWTPGKDAGPYITTMVVTRNAESPFQNNGVYRTQVLDAHRVAVNLTPGRQGTRSVRSFLDAGRPAPIAWVVAAEPAIHLATVANLPYGQDEMFVAGGLKGEPIDLVRAQTSDLLVPANAEIVIEGEIRPGETTPEGPFGEFAGSMGAVEDRPIAHITAITHRRDPLYYGIASQMSPSESTVLQSLTNAGVVLKFLRDDFGDPNIHDVWIDHNFGGNLGYAIVAMTPRHPGHGKRIGRLVAAAWGFKRITVVDADIDIRDPLHVDWALNARYNPARDTIVIDDVYTPAFMDPSLPTEGATTNALGGKLVIDATAKRDSGASSLPPRATMMRALDVWRDAGLPEFAIPKRARLRIDRS